MKYNKDETSSYYGMNESRTGILNVAVSCYAWEEQHRHALLRAPRSFTLKKTTEQSQLQPVAVPPAEGTQLAPGPAGQWLSNHQEQV